MLSFHGSYHACAALRGGATKPSLRTMRGWGLLRAWLRGWRRVSGFLRSAPISFCRRVLDDARVRAVGFDHLDAFDEHEALGELVGFGLRLGELDAGVGDCAFAVAVGGWSADGQLACAGFHVAEEAETVVGAEDLFFGEVAVEVEAVEI